MLTMENDNVMDYESGESIFREGEVGDLMYILLLGSVDLKMKVERGETVLKTVDTPNEFFGEMALLDDRPRSASAVATKRTRVLAVNRQTFETMILTNGKFALKIIKVLADRIRRSNDQVSDLIETMPRERIVWTVRKRIHVYCTEQESSPSRKLRIEWRGSPVTVELKSTGTQVAAPPTPGYTLTRDVPPSTVPTILSLWLSISAALGIGANQEIERFPTPWLDHVATHERNKAMYIEAQRLRQARVPLQSALEMLHTRYTTHYDHGDDSWVEYERTIQSAYRNGPPPGQVIYESETFR